ncbi:MAG: M20/M25/M40 family metallo-hydrolase [Saccharothrix sp.]|nr:M20/M25/M40 family metallo-hydrolase [Saccharothrix sp.]
MNDPLPAKVKGLMDQITKDLCDLVRIPSVYRDKNSDDLRSAAKKVKELLTGAGMKDVELKCIGTEVDNAPLVYGTYQVPNAPAGTPTVLLYAHYDVVEAGDWKEAFTPVPVGGRLRGRGAADDKSGVMVHVGALRAFDGAPPVHLKVVVEGEEEKGDRIEQYVLDHPELFKADVIVIADTGNYQLGKPSLTTSLRGVVDVDVQVTTLEKPVHSGLFGGPVPDAFMALVRILARLHDDAGTVLVPGLSDGEWSGHQPDEKAFRESATMKPGVGLIGTGTLGARLYTKPSVNVTKLVGGPVGINQLQDTATATVSLRIAPTQDPEKAVALLTEYLCDPALNPWHAEVVVKTTGQFDGFVAKTDGKHYATAARAMESAYPGTTLTPIGQGGSIPLVTKFQRVNLDSTFLLLGCEEPLCDIHSAPESVDLGELEAMTLAESYLLKYLSGAS